MATSNALIKALKERGRQYRKQVKAVRREASEPAVHDLRSSTRRLRAVLDAATYFSGRRRVEKIMDLLKDQFAIVTGASRGIGRAIAQELALEGAGVIVNYRSRKEDAERLVAQICDQGVRAAAFAADVSSESEVKRLIEFAVRQFGRIDILVNNAGISNPKPFLETSNGDWDEAINVNLKGVVFCTRAVLPSMLQRGSGVVVV